MNLCPCGSKKNYDDCCGLYLTGKANAKTPEVLMRSRYTAYTRANIDYIKQTMRGSALQGFHEIEAATWARRVQWLDLKVIRSYLDPLDSNKGWVEFKARFKEGDQLESIHELSEFECQEGLWFYTSGQPGGKNLPRQPKTPRNAPCPCGSQKKFKNCCLLSGKFS
ncbi:YchJ family protein [Legionella jordanis]|uniref:Putative SEC-C motif domain protein n=1 Tax=Legionella jordanis TaxID=456 RepID=A0A0W0VE60_9GAMM|nr:YchJ family metal-binding protein [Legionella jordanis]KTD18423.1 putative SEC-C motif domain protein [Legionella jordanis]RMX05329.1 hypothetical protein EAW55_01315 [Legionella jordanis]RMX20820.1 hypothetical protein EAS68_05730 [Legionella jordanis]VEH13228.1 putative SEC-C motif domain protein [Legionella jordanis]HAT8713582.1 hypothetical protein [Legionella jordanis]